MAFLLALLVCFASCATLDNECSALPPSAPELVDPPPRSGASVILVAMPSSRNFLEVRRTLVSEVQNDFNIYTFVVGPQTQSADLAAAIRATNPVCMVLMNNLAIKLYRQHRTANPTAAMPPTILLMASFIEDVQPQVRGTTGIAYEIHGVTAFVNLRSVIRTPVNRVGVVYRPSFRKFVERQRALAAREQVEIVAVSVPDDVTTAGLREALRDLAKNRKVDAVWMLNDNALVRNAELIEDAWRAEVTEAKVPLIVGVSNFVEPSSPLGTLAVVPDHEALGLQAANLIFALSASNWQTATHPVELPLSVKTVVDIKEARDNFGLQPDAMRYIDRALE